MGARLVDLAVREILKQSSLKQNNAFYALDIPDKKGVAIGRRHDSHIQIFESLPQNVKDAVQNILEKNEKLLDAYRKFKSEVSRTHAAIYINGGTYYLQDLGTKGKEGQRKSLNQTFYGREEIEGLGVEFKEIAPGQKIALKNNDVIRLSRYNLRVAIEEDEAAEQTSAELKIAEKK